jgi:hypothetical protein
MVCADVGWRLVEVMPLGETEAASPTPTDNADDHCGDHRGDEDAERGQGHRLA